MNETIHGIDPYAPGGLDALFAFHRQTFGDAVMQDPGTGGEGGDNAGNGGDGAEGGANGAPKPGPSSAQSANGGAQTQAAGSQTAEPASKPAEWDGKVQSLPEGAQKIIKDLRAKDGDERIASKVLAEIQKALDPEASNEKPNAEKLAADFAASTVEANQAKTELAIYKQAAKAGANPDELLDSRAFLAKIAEIDHTDTAKLDKAIKDMVETNPNKFKLVRAAGQSSAEFNGGSGEQRKKASSLNEAVEQHYRG